VNLSGTEVIKLSRYGSTASWQRCFQ